MSKTPLNSRSRIFHVGRSMNRRGKPVTGFGNHIFPVKKIPGTLPAAAGHSPAVKKNHKGFFPFLFRNGKIQSLIFIFCSCVKDLPERMKNSVIGLFEITPCTLHKFFSLPSITENRSGKYIHQSFPARKEYRSGPAEREWEYHGGPAGAYAPHLFPWS